MTENSKKTFMESVQGERGEGQELTLREKKYGWKKNRSGDIVSGAIDIRKVLGGKAQNLLYREDLKQHYPSRTLGGG